MCKTLKLTARFPAPPATVYALLADSAQRTACTGRAATISAEIGGAFTADDGRVRGINVDLVPGRRIVQAWRRDDFPEGVFSMAAFVLTPAPNGGTQLVLTHRGVPKALLASVEAAWKEGYWTPMKACAARGLS